MVHRSVSSFALVLGVLAVVGPSLAQGQEPGARGEAPAGAQAEGHAGGSGPATDGEKKAPGIAAAGYAYSDKKPATRATHSRYRQRGPVVNTPGFEQTPDGGSRLFVQLSQSVPIEERKAPGSITYVLKGASPRVWNNTNALVTVHFNTPVSRARLVPQGPDLLFVVELRSAATPTWKLTESSDKSAILTIDFPKGDFTTADAATEPPAAEPATPPRPARGKSSGRKPASRTAPSKKANRATPRP
jgi:hypothetical protein